MSTEPSSFMEKLLTIEKVDLEYIVGKLSDFEINKLNNSSILVTGASGFFGKNIMEFLIYLKITALTRNITNFRVKFPILDQINFIKLVESHIGDLNSNIEDKFNFIIHAACDTDPDGLKNYPIEFLKENYLGIESILEIAKRSDTCSLLYLSSGAVYGVQNADILCMDENSATAPNINNIGSVYGESKRLGEMLCTIYAKQHNLKINIARCFSLVGPHMNFEGHYAIGNFIKNIADKEDIILKSKNEVFRSYLYSADLVIWIIKILLSDRKNEVYNVGSTRDITVKDLAKLVKQTLNSESNIIFKEGEVFNTTSSNRYVPSNSKIKGHLKVEEWTSLEEAIKKTYLWYLRNKSN